MVGSPTGTFSSAVLFIADFFHPINDIAVEIFLNGNVRHGRGRRRAVPMLLARRKPNHVARTNFFNRAAFALNASTAGSNNQSLAERMRVPSRACARLEGETCAGYACRSGSAEQWINPHRAGEPIYWAFAGWLRACYFDFHINVLSLLSLS